MLNDEFTRIYGEDSRIICNRDRSILGNCLMALIFHPEGGSTVMFFANEQAAQHWCDRVQFPIGTAVCLSDEMAKKRPDVGDSVGRVDWVSQWVGYCVKFPKTMLILDWGDVCADSPKPVRASAERIVDRAFEGLIDNKTFALV